MNKDAQQINDIFEVLTNHLPKVFRSLREALFSAEAGADFGSAVGSFYASLIEKGIPKDHAFVLTQEYLGTLKSLGNMVNSSSYSDSQRNAD